MTDHILDAADGGQAVNTLRLLKAFDAVGAAVIPLPERETTEPGVARPVELSPAFGLAVDLVRHFRVEGAKPDIWVEWADSFAAYVGDEIAETMDTYLPGPIAPLEVAIEMRLNDSAKLTDPIRRQIEESTTSLEYLARQWIEKAMIFIVRRYYLDAAGKETIQ